MGDEEKFLSEINALTKQFLDDIHKTFVKYDADFLSRHEVTMSIVRKILKMDIER